MTSASPLISKVLVFEDEPQMCDAIKALCQSNNLVPLRIHGSDVMAVLQSNLDLGAVMLSEHAGGKPHGGIELATAIHKARPELPLFLRRDDRTDAYDLSAPEAALFRAVYTIDKPANLIAALDTWIFNRSYPTPLVRGIAEVTQSAMGSQFHRVSVTHESPCLVRDRLIYGELFSLIPIESNWCRGFMMLQTKHQPLSDFIKHGKARFNADAHAFRDINNILSEITNLAWGSFKNRFTKPDIFQAHLSQVPIIVNHQHKYISFGSDDPQLCIKYTITDDDGGTPSSLEILQYFVFNLNWTPENFTENDTSADELGASGELEFF